MNPKTIQIGKHQSIYYINETGLPTMAKVKIYTARPLTILDFEAFCFYVHKYFNTMESRWAVTEGFLSMTLCNCERSSEKTIEAALARLEEAGPQKFKSLIHDAYNKYGKVYDHRLIEVDENFREVIVENSSEPQAL